MAQLAQVYVHLRPYEIDAESINRLGNLAQENAVAAARAIYRGNVTIETELEEGSVKFRSTVLGALFALQAGYMLVGNYKGFKESVVAMVEDAQKFSGLVSETFTKQANAKPQQIYRVERRLKVPGKIKRLTDKLEALENMKLSDAELNAQLLSIQSELEQIEKELSPKEKTGLHELLLYFENVPPLRDFPKPLTRPSGPPAALRPKQPSLSFGGEVVSYTQPTHVLGAFAHVPGYKKNQLTFHRSVFVPPTEDQKGQEDGQPTLF